MSRINTNILRVPGASGQIDERPMGSFMAPLEAAGEAMSQLGNLGQEIAVKEQKLQDVKLVNELEAEAAQLSAAMEEQLSQAITPEQAETIRNAFQADFASIQERASGVKNDLMRSELGAKMEMTGGLGIIKIDGKRRDIDLSILQNEVSRNINNALEKAVITGDFATAEAEAKKQIAKLVDLTLTGDQAEEYLKNIMGDFKARSALSQLDGDNWRDVNLGGLEGVGYENQLLIRNKYEERLRRYKEGELSSEQIQWNRGHDARVLRMSQADSGDSVFGELDKAYAQIDKVFSDRPDDAMLAKRGLFAAVTRQYFIESAVIAGSKNGAGEVPDSSELDRLIDEASSLMEGRSADEKRVLQGQIAMMVKIREEVKSQSWDQILSSFSEEETFITEVVDRFMELEPKDRWDAEQMQRELSKGPTVGGKTRAQWEAEGGSAWLYGRVAAARRAAIQLMANHDPSNSPKQQKRSLSENPSPQNAQAISSRVWKQRTSVVNGEALPPSFVEFEMQLRDKQVPEDVAELLKWSETYNQFPAELNQWITMPTRDDRFTHLSIEDRLRVLVDHGTYPSNDPIEVNALNFREAHLANGYFKYRRGGMNHEEALEKSKSEVPPDWRRAQLIGEAILGSSEDQVREQGETVVRNVLNNLKDNNIIPRFDKEGEPLTGPEAIQARLGQNTDREFAERQFEANFMEEYSSLLLGIASANPELMRALENNQFTPHQAKDLHTRVAAAMLSNAGPDRWSLRGLDGKPVMTTFSVEKGWYTEADDSYGLVDAIFHGFRDAGHLKDWHINVQSQQPRNPDLSKLPDFFVMSSNMTNDIRQHSLGRVLTDRSMVNRLAGRTPETGTEWPDDEGKRMTALDYARDFMRRHDLIGTDGVWAKDGEPTKPFSPILHEGVTQDGDERWAVDGGVPVKPHRNVSLRQHFAANWKEFTEDEVTPGESFLFNPGRFAQERKGAIAHGGGFNKNALSIMHKNIAVEPVGMVYDERLTEYNNVVRNLRQIGDQNLYKAKEGIMVYRAYLLDKEEPDGFARNADGERIVTEEFWHTPERMLSNPELIYQIQNSLKAKYGVTETGNANNTSAFGGSRETENGTVEAAQGP